VLGAALAWAVPCPAEDLGWAVTGQARSAEWLKDHGLECLPGSPAPSDARPTAFQRLGSVEGKDIYCSQSSHEEQGFPNGSLVILEGSSGGNSAEPVWCDAHENLTIGPARIARSAARTFIEIGYCEHACWQEFLVRSRGTWVYVHGEDPLRSEIDARLRALGYERPFTTNTFVDIDITNMITEVAVKRLNGDAVASALIALKLTGDRLAVDRITIKQGSRTDRSE
jgi:hypothetical protein